MNTKQRSVVFQRWSGVIRREARDLDSLDQIAVRALGDSDVSEDPTLQAMIRTEILNRKDGLEQALRSARAPDDVPVRESANGADATVSTPPLPPDQARRAYNRLAQSLTISLERGDEVETGAVLRKIRDLQARNPAVVTPTLIEECEQRVNELRTHIEELSKQMATLAEEAVDAARGGKEKRLAYAMRRLVAIHAAHPRLLDEVRLETIRSEIADAADERLRHNSTTEKLLSRERSIAADVKALAGAVRRFHGTVCSGVGPGEEFDQAEASYLDAIRVLRTYDTEWFSGVVLDLADLLAEWSVPPLGAEDQIDRFLDSIDQGLKRIRGEIRDIKSERDGGAAADRETPNA